MKVRCSQGSALELREDVAGQESRICFAEGMIELYRAGVQDVEQEMAWGKLSNS